MTKRYTRYVDLNREQLRRRVGLSHHRLTLIINGVQMQHIVGAPYIVRERWLKHHRSRRGLHVAVERFYFRGVDQHLYTALRAITHDIKSGHVESVTGFWGLTSIGLLSA